MDTRLQNGETITSKINIRFVSRVFLKQFNFTNLNCFTCSNALYADNLITTYHFCFSRALRKIQFYSKNNSELMKWLTVSLMNIVQGQHKKSGSSFSLWNHNSITLRADSESRHFLHISSGCYSGYMKKKRILERAILKKYNFYFTIIFLHLFILLVQLQDRRVIIR